MKLGLNIMPNEISLSFYLLIRSTSRTNMRAIRNHEVGTTLAQRPKITYRSIYKNIQLPFKVLSCLLIHKTKIWW